MTVDQLRSCLALRTIINIHDNIFIDFHYPMLKGVVAGRSIRESLDYAHR